MEELIAYILKFGNLNQEQVKLISSKCHQIKLKKQAYFSEAGKVPRQVGFILNGVIRVFTTMTKVKKSLTLLYISSILLMSAIYYRL